MRTRSYSLNRDFYCVFCGKKGIPIARYNGCTHEVGHLKSLFCLNCQKNVNHAECDESTRYNHAAFLKEFNEGNFDENGNRIKPLKI